MNEEQILDYKLDNTIGRPVNLFFLAFGIIVTGAFIGGSINLVNGWVSEEYFRRIMGWDFEGIWVMASALGFLQGMVFGFLFSYIYSVNFASITKAKGDWRFAKKQLKKIVLLIYVYWAIGGIIAVVLAMFLPDIYNQWIYGVPLRGFPRVGYAWVGGSIWGGTIGGVIAIFWGVKNTRLEWKKYKI